MASRMANPESSWVDAAAYPQGVGGKELLTDMERLNITDTRPDIKEAQEATEKMKEKLVYRNVDELDIGLQKVQPLQYLDEEIDQYHEQIRDSVPASLQVNDKIPQSVLDKVDHVVNLAHKGETSLFKASELLATTIEAYQYARDAAQDKFDIQRKSWQSLDSYDESFGEMIASRINTNIQEAETHESQCYQHLESALEAARSDFQSCQERMTKEDGLVAVEGLKEAHDSVREDIKVERGELLHIQDQCTFDMGAIDTELQKLHVRMETAGKEYASEQGKRVQKLSQNRSRQKELREELKRLEEEDVSLVRESQVAEKLQAQAQRAEEEATQHMGEWRRRIEELQKKTGTSLEVMRHMEECTEVIMEDAKAQKRRWKDRLCQLELEGLLSLRDSVMASGGMYMRAINDCKKNREEIGIYLVEQEREKKRVAKTGFARRVKDLETSIQQYQDEMGNFEEKIRNNSEVLAQLRGELEEVDGKIKALRPGIKLDTMEERFQVRKQLMEQAFQKESVQDIHFQSRANYSA